MGKLRQGFFFTVMALIILSVMLLSVQLWVRSFEQSDENYAAKFKGEAMRLVLYSLSDNQLSDFAKASAYYAVYKLANYSAYHNIADEPANDPDNPGTGKIEKAIRSLIVNGSAEFGASAADILNYSEEEKSAYTMDAWRQKIAESAGIMGFQVSFSDPKNFTVKQVSPWDVKVSFEMDMNISDMEGSMRQSKKLKAEANFSIEGFLDPSITRNDRNLRNTVEPAEKQIFRHANYINATSIKPVIVANGSEGNGWFAGPITEDRPGEGIFENATGISKIRQYILYVSRYEEGLEDYANLYGAVIIGSLPGSNTTEKNIGGCIYNITEQTNCLNCKREYSSADPGCTNSTEWFKNVSVPVIAVNGFDLSKITKVSRKGLNDEYYVLIDNEKDNYQDKDKGYHRIWDLTKLRDMAICGFYVQEENAPSFFQRMLADVGTSTAGAVKSSKYGIETLLLGSWVGGKDDYPQAGNHDQRSRVDWEFYSLGSSPIARVKGMAGCKSKDMCDSNAPIVNGTGKFWLSQDAAGRYGVEKILYGGTTSGNYPNPS